MVIAFKETVVSLTKYGYGLPVYAYVYVYREYIVKYWYVQKYTPSLKIFTQTQIR